MDDARRLNVSIRPHLKTSKSPGLARHLIESGAIGCCVAKLSEAEIMAEAGVSDLLITTEIAGQPKISRLASLAARTPGLKIVVDSAATVLEINDHMARVNHRLDVLIDLNVGQNRCGVQDNDEAINLAELIAKCPYLKLIGIQGYEGHLQMLGSEHERRRLCHESMHKLTKTAQSLRNRGYQIEIVTTGGTGTYKYCAEIPGITEVQPGSFIFMDLSYAKAGRREFQQALFVLSTVISKPCASRAVVDAGMKSLSTDSGYAEPLDSPGVKYRSAGDEHGILEAIAPEGAVTVDIGEKILFVPSHIDTTVNLHDNYFCVRAGKLEDIWRISARGKVQ